MTSLPEPHVPCECLMSISVGTRPYERVTLAAGKKVDACGLVSIVSGDYVPFDPNGSDGSEKPVGVAYGPCDATEGEQDFWLLVRDAVINANAIDWPDGITGEQKSIALGWLAENSGLVTRGLPITAQSEPEAPSYVGPLDLVPGAVVAYSSARALSTAMCGQNGYTLRAVDTTERAFAYNASTGAIDSTAISAWVAAHGTAGVKLLEDHSGGGTDLSQATASKQPTWTASGPNSKPSFVFTPVSESDLTNLSANLEFSAGFTSFIVFKASELTAQQVLWMLIGADQTVIHNQVLIGGGLAFLIGNDDETEKAGGNTTEMFAEDIYVLIEVAAQVGARTVLFSGANANANGDNDSGTLIPTISLTSVFLGVNDGGVGHVDGEIAELLVYSGVLSTGNRTTLRQNIAAYYGITLP